MTIITYIIIQNKTTMAVLQQLKDLTLNNDKQAEPGLSGKKPTPIGIGKPLSIEILSFYTGKFEKKRLSKKEDRQLLIVSAIKNIEDVHKPVKAINQIINNANPNTLLKPTVDSEGSPLLFYTRSLDQFNLKINIKIAANKINNKLINHVSTLIEQSGTIPAFIGASPYLATANKAVKLGSKLVEFFHESNATFDEDLDLSINSDFMKDSSSGVQVQIPAGKHDAFTNYKLAYREHDFTTAHYELVHKDTDKPYSGEIPYIIVGITGKERPNLDNFMPLIASQAILNDFFGGKNNPDESAINEITQAISLLNDMKYLKKAKDQAKKLSLLNPSDEDYQKGQDLLEAYVENITEDVIRSGFKSSIEIAES